MKLSRFIFYLFLFVIILVVLNIILLFDMTKSRINGLNDFDKFDFDYKVSREERGLGETEF